MLDCRHNNISTNYPSMQKWCSSLTFQQAVLHIYWLLINVMWLLKMLKLHSLTVFFLLNFFTLPRLNHSSWVTLQLPLHTAQQCTSRVKLMTGWNDLYQCWEVRSDNPNLWLPSILPWRQLWKTNRKISRYWLYAHLYIMYILTRVELRVTLISEAKLYCRNNL